MAWIRDDKNGCIIEIHAQPQAKKNEVVGLHNDRLKVKIKSPPVEGKANECLIEFLADLLNVSRSSVTLLSGETSRQKKLHVRGLFSAQVEPELLKRTSSK